MIIHIINISKIKKKDIDSLIKKYNLSLYKYYNIQNIISKILIKKYISSENISYNKNGKPYINKKKKFNISHSKDFVCIVLSNKNDVGIDIEKITIHKKYKLISKKYFTNAENNYIKNFKNFLYIWTRKESFIKCLGISLAYLDKIPELLKNKILYKSTFYFIKTFEYKKYLLSVTYNSSIKKNICVREIFLENL